MDKQAIHTRPESTTAPSTLGAGGSRSRTLKQRLDKVIEQWVTEQRIVGVVALVAERGQLVYQRAAGFADREARRPIHEHTVFRLASLTKAIVSVAALILIEQRRLRLDDPVEKWLPYFTPRLADGSKPFLTVRHLMTHTSGLSYGFFEEPGSPYLEQGFSEGLDASKMTLEEMLRGLARVPLLFEPGTAWRYSLSTDVLGGVIEKVTGQALPQAVRQLVTQPLAMVDTDFIARDPERLAYPYRDGKARAFRMNAELDCIPYGSGIRVSPARVHDPRAYPSGGASMVGSAPDYLRFVEAMRCGGGPLLRVDTARWLSTHTIGDLRAWTEGDGWGFGLGAAVLLDPVAAATPQSPGTWQWGGVLGNHWFVDPVRESSVVVMTNTAVAGVIGPFPEAIRDAVYGA